MFVVKRRNALYYGIGMILIRGPLAYPSKEFQRLHEALGITNRTLQNRLNLYIRTGLVKKGTGVEKRGCPYYELSNKGKVYFSRTRDLIHDIRLEPNTFQLPHPASLGEILENVTNIFNKIFIVSMLSRTESFDMGSLFRNLFKTDTKSNIQHSGLFRDYEGELMDPSFSESIIKETAYGLLYHGYSDEIMINGDDERVNLAMAFLTRIQGKHKTAESMYRRILKSKNIDKNQWIIANIGLSQCQRMKGDKEGSLERLNILIKEDNTPLQKGYILMVKGWLLSEMEREDESMKLFKKSEGIFQYIGNPFLLTMVQTYTGVAYFRKCNYEMADHFWNKALKNSRRAKCDYLKGYVYVNLADIQIKKGDMKKAYEFLKSSENIFRSTSDLEGVSVLEFNWSLYFIAKGDIDEAINRFRKSETVAYPLPYPFERNERREVFLERIREKGIDLDTNIFITPP